MDILKLAGLFAVTALAEIVGCYLPWLALKQGRTMWLLPPAALALCGMAVIALQPATPD